TMHNYVLNAGNSNLYQVSTPGPATAPGSCTGGSTIGANGCVTFGEAPFGWYEDPASYNIGGDASPTNYGGASPDLAKGRARKIASITDGTSNTLCVSEVL